MSLEMNWVDLVIILLLAFFAIEAIGRSFLTEFLDLISFILALVFSFRFYNLPANFFESQFQLPHGLSLAIGFMATWFLTEALFYILVRSFLPKIKLPLSQYLSIIPALLRGLIFISLFLVLIATFPMQPQIKKSVQDSQIGSFLLSKAYQLEQPIKQVFGGLSQDSLTFLTIKPQTDERVNLGFQTKEFKPDPVTEEAMVSLVNQERTSRGLKALIFDSKLRDVGRNHSQDMFERGYFSHYSPEGATVADRAASAGVDFLVIGENLAYAPNLELAHQGLMNSEGHRANILSPDFGKIGIGVADGDIYGKMFTQVFTNSRESNISSVGVLVIKVIDGDTIEIEGGQKVRYLGVDTPETKDPRKPVGCFGKEAASENKELVEGKRVILENDITEMDKYGRLLQYVFLPLPDGSRLFVNDFLIREGYGQVLTIPPDVEYAEQFLEAQRQAREEKRGLWGKCL